MKTVIEMAREAGATFDHMTWVERDLAPVFERFAALVREDAIDKFNRQLNQACEEARLLDHSGEATDMVQECRHCGWLCKPNSDESKKWYPLEQNHSEQDLNMVQEPVAYAAMVNGEIAWDADYPFSNEPFTCFDDEQSIPLYTTPPTAALAAKQMRDAAVKVCRGYMPTEAQLKEAEENGGFLLANVCRWLHDAIAALPVPEAQWRDDEALDALQDMVRTLTDGPDDSDVARVFNKANAVIAKFKEKQHG